MLVGRIRVVTRITPWQLYIVCLAVDCLTTFNSIGTAASAPTKVQARPFPNALAFRVQLALPALRYAGNDCKSAGASENTGEVAVETFGLWTSAP
ncbi:hypothetical protein HDV63DRAFT_357092 [Trichoderma sp. SZMC 28014]